MRGAFEAIWRKDGEPWPGHLPLLGLYDCEREIAILRGAIGASDVESTFRAMLAEANWRPNLVAATAVAFFPRDGRFAALLWTALDEGSWVSPQIAVVLSLHDPDFVAGATDRITRHCPMTGARWGGQFEGTPNAKTLTALVAVLDELDPKEAARLRADPEIIGFFGRPLEGGDRIAASWRSRLLSLLATPTT